MAQIKNYPDAYLKDMNEKCLVCGEKKPYRIFYCLQDGLHYVCQDCENTIQGLYIDIILERAENENKTVDEIVSSFLEKIHRIEELRKGKNMFKYYVNGGIIDFFDLSFTTQEMIQKFPKRKKEFLDREMQIISVMTTKEGEKPHTIRFFGMPDFDMCDMKIYALAKITNNGTTYLFGDDPNILNAFGLTYSETAVEL